MGTGKNMEQTLTGTTASKYNFSELLQVFTSYVSELTTNLALITNVID